jgi:hypothetical protein
LRFAIREGGRTVGAGVVASIIESGYIACHRAGFPAQDQDVETKGAMVKMAIAPKSSEKRLI